MIDLEQNGNKLQVAILDYEFPDLADLGGAMTAEQREEMGPDYDANWLLLRLTGEKDGKSWQAEDPFLLTWEAETLMQWFVELAQSKDRANITPTLAFLEPCFVCNQQEQNGVIRLTIDLFMDLAAPNTREGEATTLTFEITRRQAAELADGIASQLAQYPTR